MARFIVPVIPGIQSQKPFPGVLIILGPLPPIYPIHSKLACFTSSASSRKHVLLGREPKVKPIHKALEAFLLRPPLVRVGGAQSCLDPRLSVS